MWSNAQQQQQQQQQSVNSILSDNPWGTDTSSTLQQQTTSEINSWATFPTDNFADFDSHFESFDMPQGESGNAGAKELMTNNDTATDADQFYDANLEDSHDEIIT